MSASPEKSTITLFNFWQTWTQSARSYNLEWSNNPTQQNSSHTRYHIWLTCDIHSLHHNHHKGHRKIKYSHNTSWHHPQTRKIIPNYLLQAIYLLHPKLHLICLVINPFINKHDKTSLNRALRTITLCLTTTNIHTAQPSNNIPMLSYLGMFNI